MLTEKKSADVPSDLLGQLETKPVAILVSPQGIHSSGSSGAADRSEIPPSQDEQLAEAKSLLKSASDHLVAESDYVRLLEARDAENKEFLKHERQVSKEAKAAAKEEIKEVKAEAKEAKEEAAKSALTAAVATASLAAAERERQAAVQALERERQAAKDASAALERERQAAAQAAKDAAEREKVLEVRLAKAEAKAARCTIV